MTLDEKTPVFPGDDLPVFQKGAQDGINWTNLSFSTHFGTHVDAPFHMLERGKKLSDYPLGHFIGEAVVLDVRGKKEIRCDLSDVKKGDFLFFLTGHTKNYSRANFFDNNPVIPLDFAKEIVSKKSRIVGLDSFTPDNAPYDVHKLFFKHDILSLENLVNLEGLAGKRVECMVMPLNLSNSDGSQCRVIARELY